MRNVGGDKGSAQIKGRTSIEQAVRIPPPRTFSRRFGWFLCDWTMLPPAAPRGRMPAVKRRLFNLLAVVSLVLCVGTAAALLRQAPIR